MLKQIVFAICGCLWLSIGFSQTTTIDGVLGQIEQNNKELKTLMNYIKSQELKLKTLNHLPDPQLSAYYLPMGQHSTGDYTEIQVSQTFEFPTVYANRKVLVSEELTQLKQAYQTQRLEILEAASSDCLRLIYVNKSLLTQQDRVEQARTIYNQVQELFNKEQVGILELNKAKVAWLQDQFKMQQLEGERQSLLHGLHTLNGGQPVALEANDYGKTLELDQLDSLWLEKLAKDPNLLQLKQNEVISLQQIKLAKSQALPNLTVGYNHQGVRGEQYSGIYGGVSIPLWSSKNTVKAAQAQLEFQESETFSSTQKAYSSFTNAYRTYQTQLSQYKEYQNTLEGLSSEKLLFRAYELGEISFLEYYMELQFYREAFDAMLAMQHELQQWQNSLLKHQL